MRQHPIYAYKWLAPILYLKPALDIAYCHHEKWEGSGYPRGLQGEQIPLAARIFAVVDVWDALTNDRLYRSAWTKEQTLEYIKQQSGHHFDPRVRVNQNNFPCSKESHLRLSRGSGAIFISIQHDINPLFPC